MSGTQTKYLCVTGGVLSGVGKGITAAALGVLLEARGYKVSIQKCDPYLNTDAGTLNPAEHGEVFVTKDGAEADLDLGHYERFLNIELTKTSSLMSGRVLSKVIADERAGKYLGKTVQIIPHVTNAMQDFIVEAARGSDVHIIEVGGTVGDIESLAFIEALRQLKNKVGHDNVVYAHVVYLPYLEASQEIKTKPAQNAVRDLREAGIQPDFVFARADKPVQENVLKKVSLYSDVPVEAVVPMPTVQTVYQVPLLLEERGIGELTVKKLGLKPKRAKLGPWQKLVKTILDESLSEVRIGIVAKYLDHQDTYTSVVEALKAAGWARKRRVRIEWINAEKVTRDTVASQLSGVAGIVVPGGFGSRGIEGKIVAAQYALQHNVPYLGLCLGMQVAAVGAARLSGKDEANSREFDEQTSDPVIDIMESQKAILDKGGTMRLGDYMAALTKGSKVRSLYGESTIVERHRHRYEFNNAYESALSSVGLEVVGRNPETGLAEFVEAPKHPFYIGTQAHPEFKSRPLHPHPLFDGLVKACIDAKQKV